MAPTVNPPHPNPCMRARQLEASCRSCAKRMRPCIQLLQLDLSVTASAVAAVMTVAADAAAAAAAAISRIAVVITAVADLGRI